MGDEAGFSEKWDFRRQENNFDDDSSSDDPDSNSTHDPVIHNPTPVLDSSQLDIGTTTLTREQPVKTRKRRTKKDESKPQQAKQVRRRKPKIVCAEKNEDDTVMEDKKKEETVLEEKEKDETATETDDVGMFMKTLLDDLTASRESLMVWMSTELYGSSDQNVASRPSPKKRAVAAVAAQRSVKKRRTKKMREEEEKESEKQNKQDEICQEMNKPKQKSSEIAQNGGEQVQELDYNAGSLDMFLKSSQGGLGRNYFQQQEKGQERTEMDNEKNATVTNQKSVVLAIKAPKLIQRQKKTRETNTIMNRSSSMVERMVSETQKDDDSFAIPFAPKLSSSSSSLQSFPVGYPSLNSLFPSSTQGVTSLASNNNNNFQPPVVSQIPDLSESQTGLIGGQGFGNSLFYNNGYISDFPAAFQPNLIAGSYNLPAQVSPATTSSQQNDNNNMFGGLRMTGGAIRYFGNRFPDSDVGNGNNSFSDYRTSSGR